MSGDGNGKPRQSNSRLYRGRPVKFFSTEKKPDEGRPGNYKKISDWKGKEKKIEYRVDYDLFQLFDFFFLKDL